MNKNMDKMLTKSPSKSWDNIKNKLIENNKKYEALTPRTTACSAFEKK